nr:Rib/alpha-like domain-containing protein [Enterococcus faecalis]
MLLEVLTYEGVIEVTYPDGTKDTVKVPVELKT